VGSTPWITGKRCTVRVPATSANLGPGFDSLGLALGLYDVVEAEVIAHGLDVEVVGEGAGHVPLDRDHLVVRALDTAAMRWGLPPVPGLRLRAHNAIPHGRGLGSSAAAVVAGITLAELLSGSHGEGWDRLAVAHGMEGHPDNAAAALMGGLTIAWCDHVVWGDDEPVERQGTATWEPRAVRLQPHVLIEPVVLVPEHRLETQHARSVLPSLVPHTDAARNAGRAALLIHALTSDPALLLPATEDWLHQRQRSTAMLATWQLVEHLRDRGHAAVVSGAGPSVLVLCVGAEDGGPGQEAEQLLAAPPEGWAAMAPGIAHQGTRAGLSDLRSAAPSQTQPETQLAD
jgi:homoserine kinase